MESLVKAWEIVLLASVFVFPQLLGTLLYCRLHWAPRWIARTAAILAPGVFFFWLAPILFLAGLREEATSGPKCGMPALAAAMFVLAGTIMQVVLGLITHAVLAARKYS